MIDAGPYTQVHVGHVQMNISGIQVNVDEKINHLWWGMTEIV